jgi:hypothetical protein
MPDPLTPSERSQRARIGGLARSASHDGHEATQKARDTFLERFTEEVDPDRVLPEAERDRRAEAARKRYFAQLAYKSAKARRR